MNYCTVEDVLNQVPQERAVELTNDSESRLDGAEVVTAKIEACITAAQSIVDGVLRSVVSLPLATVDKILLTITRDLAIYELYKRRVVLEMPEGLSELRKNAMSLLSRIASGEIRLDLPTGVEPSFNTRIKAPQRVFTDELLAGYGK